MKIKSLIAIPFLAFALLSCQEEEEPQLFSQAQIFDIDNGVFNTNSYIEAGDAHSGKKFSRADVGNNFGFGYAYNIPDSLAGKELFVDVDAWVRTGDVSNGCELILSASTKDSIVLWTGCGAKKVIQAPNQWSNVVATIAIPANLTALPNFKITVLAHNAEAKSYFDVDDLKFTVYEKAQEK